MAGISSWRTEYFGVPWEEDYGYPQALEVGDTIYVSGQLSHDQEGSFVAAAPLDADGRVLDAGNTERQLRTAYANAERLLRRFGCSLDNVVSEVIYVIDMDAGIAAAGPVRKAAYGTERPHCASTIVGVTRFALPQQLVEVSFVARR